MLEQHQDSLLPRVTQGEEGHETAEKRPDLVFINRVLHIVNTGKMRMGFSLLYFC